MTWQRCRFGRALQWASFYRNYPEVGSGALTRSVEDPCEPDSRAYIQSPPAMGPIVLFDKSLVEMLNVRGRQEANLTGRALSQGVGLRKHVRPSMMIESAESHFQGPNPRTRWKTAQKREANPRLTVTFPRSHIVLQSDPR